MPFPKLQSHRPARPGAYELQMGRSIASLVELFSSQVADSESNSEVLRLVSNPDCWSAGHAFFDEVRNRLLLATQAQDRLRASQYYFEEACCQAVYNATNPPNPFDPGSAFFVVPFAHALAQSLAIPEAQVVAALSANA